MQRRTPTDCPCKEHRLDCGKDSREVYRSRGIYLKSSSQKLHQVYGQLMNLFPDAGQQNFDAFYDHLCVLDLL